MLKFWNLILIITLSFLMTLLLIKFFSKLAIIIKLMDYPNLKRKTQKVPVPVIGGLAIFLSNVIVLIEINFFYKDISQLVNLFLLGFCLLLVGLIDDKWGLSAKLKILFQFLVSILMYYLVFSTYEYSNYLSLITVIAIVAIINAFNFNDNSDGNLGGIAIIISSTLAILFLMQENIIYSLLSIVVSASLISFLLFNLDPAKIYLGDAGSLFIGFLLTSLSLIFVEDLNLVSLFIILNLFFVPILDLTLVIISRLRDNKKIYLGARDHLTHRLIKKKFSKNQTALFSWTLAFIFCIHAILIKLYELNLINIIFTIISFIVILVVFLRLDYFD